MSFGQRSGPPSWFVILLGIAIVFGVYYLWLGIRNFMSTGVPIIESTEQARERSTATAVRILEIELNAPTPLPSFTPVPDCQEFAIRVREAIVRSEPDISSRIVEALREGDIVCVIAKVPNSEWYLIDQNPLTRRIDKVYMHQDIIRALNPTATPTDTLTPTPSPTPTITLTPTIRPTDAPAAATDIIPRPSPSPSQTATAIPLSVNL